MADIIVDGTKSTFSAIDVNGYQGGTIVCRAPEYTPKNPVWGAANIDDTANGASKGKVVTFTEGWTGWTNVNGSAGFVPGTYDMYVRMRDNGAGSNPTNCACGLYDGTNQTYPLNGWVNSATNLITTAYKEFYVGRFTLTNDNISHDIKTYFSFAGNTTQYFLDYIRFTPSTVLDSSTVGAFGTSSCLNNTDILANQSVALSYTMSSSSIVVSWAQQSILRSDGSTLRVLGGPNMCSNPNGDTGISGWSQDVTKAISGTAFGLKYGQNALVTTDRDASYGTFPVTPGDTWYFSITGCPAQVCGSGIGLGANGPLTVGLILYNSAGAVVGYSAISATISQSVGGWTTISGTLVIPAGCYTANVWVQIGAAWGYCGAWAFRDVVAAKSNGSMTYSGLSASTTYYIYPYLDLTTGTVNFTNGTPPPTAANSTMILQQGLDGRMSCPSVTCTTLASSSSGSGSGNVGGIVCPEANELLDVRDKGQIKAADIQVGDFVKGKSFKTGEDVYRQVTQTKQEINTAWRVVDGHKVTPCEPVYWDGKWQLAFRVPGATVDQSVGTKVMIAVESDEYDEQNYYLVSGNPLLIHNRAINC